MTEVQREAVLYERAQARLAKAERRELEKKMRELEKGSIRPARAPSAAMEKKRRTLDELKARREKRRHRNSDSDYYDGGEEGELKGPELSEESESSEDEYNHNSLHRKSSGTALLKKQSTATEIIDLETAGALLLRRNTIAKWMFHPDFDELCRGCLVRLSIGFKGNEQIYRLVEIKKIVKYHRNYKLNELTTNKAGVLKYGRNEKTFRLDVTSNSEFTQAEFDRWIETMREEHQPIVTKKSAESRIKGWKSLESKPVSDEIVSAMVAAKREVGAAPRNMIAERTMLLHLRDEALGVNNAVEVERIDEELSQLAREQAAQPTRQMTDPRLEALAELNRRNRLLNVANAREAERKNNKRSEMDNRLDPFSRRKCQPTDFNTYFSSNDALLASTTSEPPKEQLNTTQPAAESGPPPPAHSSEAAGPPKLEDVPPGPIDLFAAHNVDIEIDI